MKPITIEFFHDVICSFCFPMSYHMRELKKQMSEIKVVHRSFALVYDEKEAFAQMFGSRDRAKDEILTHWAQANQLDPEHRFNIEGMREATFPFPGSMVPLSAAKAAGRLGGDDLYWDAFDALQTALFSKSQNINDPKVIYDVLKDVIQDMDAWNTYFNDEETLKLVKRDLNLATRYGVRSVPTLIINGKYSLNGARPLNEIKAMLEKISNSSV